MKLTLFNGSPKKGMNNTEALAERFAAGFTESGEHRYAAHRLNGFKDLDEAVRIYRESECVIIAFPLYNYSMTSIVKEFIEKLEPVSREDAGRKMGFLVQFGFPEAIHARALERYLEKLAALLHCGYLGTILKGGCNDMARKPKKHRKEFAAIAEIGRGFGATGSFDKAALGRFSKPETLAFLPGIVLRFITVCINRFYWDADLKKNGAYENRFARPYREMCG